jgi:hypothetical protein
MARDTRNEYAAHVQLSEYVDTRRVQAGHTFNNPAPTRNARRKDTRAMSTLRSIFRFGK